MGDDSDLFRSSVGPVRPVRGGDQRPPRKPRATVRVPRHRHQQTIERDGDGCAHGSDATLAPADTLFLRPGLQRRTVKQLQGARFEAQETLDLHGLTAEPARRLLDAFLQECLGRGLTRVRIVHGKGHRSQDRQAVLKPLVAACLRQYPAVLAFCPAGTRDGGDGATRVLLKRR